METNVPSSPGSSPQQQSVPTTPQGGSNQAGQAGQTSQGEVNAKSVTQSFESGDKKQTSPSQPKGEPETFEVKVNGKTVKMSRQEVIDYASMSHAANSKFDEASKLRKSVDSIINTAKTNPIQALMDPALGLTKDQIRDAFETWYTKEYIEPESLTPEQKQLKEVQSRLKSYEEAEQEKIRQQKESEETELTNKQREYLQGQIIDAIDRSGLPKSKWIASRMAFYMRENLTKGWEAPIDLIVSQVKQERQSIMSDLTDNSEGDTLISLLGEGVVNKIRQYDLKRLRDQRSAKAPEFTKAGRHSSDGYGNDDKISSSEVTRRLREMRSGKKTF